ncbi:MAG: DUF2812 domain-containing protein [Lachnospiraceae bacterium]|nr:DUF2812 domain-containing protein [Lachnospiraceae bacterium]
MRKTRFRFFTIADYDEEELWLREQHRAGWKLVKMAPPGFFTFESCEPEDVIYRLDYKNSAMSEEYLQMARDFGWEYFESCFGWLYFRKPAAAAAADGEDELFSDNASKAEMAGRIVKTRLLPLALIFLGCVIPNLVNSLRGGSSLSGFFTVVFGIMFVIYVYLLVHCGLKLKAIREKYGR